MLSVFYTMRDSDRRTEQIGSVGENPQWTAFSGQMSFARFYEGYNSTATHREFVQAMVISRDIMDDDQTGILRGDRFRKMVRSGNITKQSHGARVFNMATSIDNYFYAMSENVPLVSASHTTRVPGVSTASGFSNLIIGGLTQTNYRAARILMKLFRNDQGDLTDIDGDMLLTTVTNEPEGQTILKTTTGLGTPFGDVNPEANTAKLVAWNRLTDMDAWFLINTSLMKESLIWWDRVPIEYEMIKEFNTKAIKWSGYGRWSPQLAPEWRWCCGGIPA